MNKISSIFLLAISLFQISLIGQGIVGNDYIKLKSQGDFPEEWRFSLEKGSPNNFEKEYSNTKVSTDFFQKNDYVLKQIYNSGLLYYGDSITMYINDVANYILQQVNPELVGKFKFYTAGSQYVNATSMSQGVIFVNVGLIAQLSNEAELAFVIAHEISHNLLHHSAIRYNEKQSKSGKKYRDLAEIIFKNNYNSREDESAADENAIKEMLAKTNYNLKGAITIFDVLQYSYLPLDNIPLSTNYFDLPTFKISPRSFIGPDSLTKIAISENYDEKKSTHPKCATRREAARDLIYLLDDGTPKVFYNFGESRFMRIRDYARFETVYKQIISKEIPAALYNIYILEQSYPGNKYLETAKAYCLYISQVYRNLKDVIYLIPNYENIEGESGQINYFLRHADVKELNVLSVRNLFNLVKKYPGDDFIMTLYLDALKSMIYEQDITLGILKKTSKENEVVDTTKNNNTGSKYSNIKKSTVPENYKYAFWDIIDDPLFSENMKTFEKSDKESDQLNKLKAKEKYRKEDFNKIAILNPEYHKVTNRRNITKVILRDEEGKEELLKAIPIAAQAIGMDASILDNNHEHFNTEGYNNKALIFNTFIEMFNEDCNQGEILFNRIYSDKMIMDNGARFCGLNMVNMQRDKKSFAEVYLFLLVFYITAPGLIIPDYSTTSTLLVIDIKTGEMIGIFENKIGNGDNAMKYAIYNTFYKFVSSKSADVVKEIEDVDAPMNEETKQ